MAQSSRVDVAMRPDYEGVLLALSGKTKLILVIDPYLPKCAFPTVFPTMVKSPIHSVAQAKNSGPLFVFSLSLYATSNPFCSILKI